MTDFVARLAALLPATRETGSILLGIQAENSSFRAHPFDGTVPPEATHINTALFRPEDGPRRRARWLERSKLATHTAWLVLDDIGNPDKASQTPSVRPTAKVWTSEGSEQWIYVYNEPVTPRQGQAMALGAVLADLSDEFIGDRTHHWHRLPGSLPLPKIRQGRTEKARLIDWTGRTFSYERLADALGVTPREGKRSDYAGSVNFDDRTASQDPLMMWLDRNGHTPDGYDAGFSSRGFAKVRCPNYRAHTDWNQPWAFYLPPNAESPQGFNCFHSHCNGVKGPKIGLYELRTFAAENGGPSLAESMAYVGKMESARQPELTPEEMEKLRAALAPEEHTPAQIAAMKKVFENDDD